MKKRFYLMLLLFAPLLGHSQSDCSFPRAVANLDVNNARATLMNAGDMFNQGLGYYVPARNQSRLRSPVFAGALWIGGYDSTDNEVVTMSQTYRQGQSTFWAGPISPGGVGITQSVCQTWDRMFTVRKSTIDSFRVAWQAGISSTAIPASILGWPGKNNPNMGRVYEAFNQTGVNMNLDLAPFMDVNADGIYNPVDGDYPKILGDQSVWWVMNDIGNVKRYPLPPVIKNFGIEIQVEAFAISDPSRSYLDNNTFYRYKLINKSGRHLNQTHIGFWLDPDLGNYNDDYVGSDVMRGLGYCYNGDDIDEGPLGYGDTIPTVGIDFLDGILADPNDGIDNDRDGLVDEPGERIPMSNFLYYNNNNNPKNGNPNRGIEFSNFLRSKWRDGTQVVFNTQDAQTSPPYPWARFFWPGNSDPYGFSIGGSMQNPTPLPSNWTEFSVPNPPGDRRFVASMGPFTWVPGQVQEFTMVVLFAQADSAGAMPSVRKLMAEDDSVQAWFNRGMPTLPNQLRPLASSGKQQLVKLVPNPNDGSFTVMTEAAGIRHYRIIDVKGQVLHKMVSESTQTRFSGLALPTGLYLLEVQDKSGRQSLRFEVK